MIDRPRLTAALTVLLVTLIWSVGTLLVKTGLATAPPLTLAALQVTLAAVVLNLVALARGEYTRSRLPRPLLTQLAAMGVIRYTVGQTALVLALARLPASTATFLLSFASLTALVMGIAALREIPTWLQVCGVLLATLGAYVYFAARPTPGEWIGIGFTAVNVVAFSLYNIIARDVGRERKAGSLVTTAISLACGAPVMLVAAWWRNGPPHLADFGSLGLLAVLWGGTLDTALSLSLWNRALRTLWAFEVSVLARAQMIEVPILAGWFLGDPISFRQWAGILITLIGIVLSQRRPAQPQAQDRNLKAIRDSSLARQERRSLISITILLIHGQHAGLRYNHGADGSRKQQ